MMTEKEIQDKIAKAQFALEETDLTYKQVRYVLGRISALREVLAK